VIGKFEGVRFYSDWCFQDVRVLPALGKVVENHPVSWFFVKSVKTGSFRPNIVVFLKIHQNGWFSTTITFFFQKTEKCGKKNHKSGGFLPKNELDLGEFRA